ncbi:MAG: protein-L-isoaspartate(D-aspartate) O-methyltransferase [Holosporaceae bacterium]
MKRQYILFLLCGLLCLLMAGQGGVASEEEGVADDKKNDLALKRQQMVREALLKAGIQDQRVLKAMATVPRHAFVANALLESAYENHPLSLCCGQTISQPFIVAYMIEMANLTPQSRVLEIGTGCGYNAAVLSRVCRRVYSLEIHQALHQQAKQTLSRLGYHNIELAFKDGVRGWPDVAPFDAILSTAASTFVPQSWQDQLKEGGCLIMPLEESDGEQYLWRFTKVPGDPPVFKKEKLLAVRFVPLLRDAKTEGDAQ